MIFIKPVRAILSILYIDLIAQSNSTKTKFGHKKCVSVSKENCCHFQILSGGGFRGLGRFRNILICATGASEDLKVTCGSKVVSTMLQIHGEVVRKEL